MASHQNFKKGSNKNNTRNRNNVYDPDLNPTVKINGFEEMDSFTKNLEKYKDFVSWARWNPDLWWDFITPQTGGIRLDLDQRVYLRCTARFVSNYMVFPRGYGKCADFSTLLYTSDGMREIGSYFDYDTSNEEKYIKSDIKLINRYGKLESTNAGVYSGKKKTKIIKTEEGYEIQPSLNHPLLVFTKEGKLEWKKTEDIEINDKLPIARKIDVWGNKTKLNIDMAKFKKENQYKNKCNIPNDLTEEMALILGYLIGDGGLTTDGRITLTNPEQDIVNNFIEFFENKMNVKVYHSKSHPYDYSVYGKYLKEIFKQIGITNADAFNKKIPQSIMEAPKNIVAKFIQGLFDTDGGLSNSYIEYCTASEKLSKQVQSVLLNFGIISTREKKYNKQFETYSYRIMIYSKNMDIYFKEIGFSCKRKQDKLIELCKKKRNVNKDVIPFQKNYVKQLYKEVKKENPYLYDKLYHVMQGNNDLTYEKLNFIMSLVGIEKSSLHHHFKELQENYYFFSSVETIEDNEAHVCDLSLPETHSFVSNGFISHNTLLELMGMVHTAIFFPDIELTMTAQTKENAAKLVDEKWREILKFYPLIKNEVVTENIANDRVEIVFTSGGRIDIMANAQSSKGARRKRINIEESALLNAALFEDVLEPIVNVPRRTIGKEALVDPEEMNGQINYMTTSGFRGSHEFQRNLDMVDDMAELKGKIVLGSDWQLAVNYGRGEPKSKLLEKKAKLSPTFFAQNYEGKWVGASDGAIVNINTLIDLRTLSKPEFEPDKKSDYVMAVDVARSNKQNNNKTSIVVLKIKRNKEGKILKLQAVNIINLQNGLNFTGQAIEVKRIQNIFNAKMVVVDVNGVGVGLKDELLKEQLDPMTDKSLGCWDTVNTDDQPDVAHSPKLVYALTAQGINHDIIIAFTDYVESEKLQLLTKITDNNYDVDDTEFINKIKPHTETDMLIAEIANLKTVLLNNGRLKVEQLTKRVDKDRYSALAMGIWYVKNFEDRQKEIINVNPNDYFFAKSPKLYN